MGHWHVGGWRRTFQILRIKFPFVTISFHWGTLNYTWLFIRHFARKAALFTSFVSPKSELELRVPINHSLVTYFCLVLVLNTAQGYWFHVLSWQKRCHELQSLHFSLGGSAWTICILSKKNPCILSVCFRYKSFSQYAVDLHVQDIKIQFQHVCRGVPFSLAQYFS